MSDEELRDAERAWRASGALDDEVRCLRARLRAGQLDRERLALARRLGSPAAAALLAEPEPSSPEAEDDGAARAAWFGGLAAWGTEVAVRALVAMVQPLLPRRWPRTGHPDDELQRAVEQVEAWVREPDAANAARLVRLEQRYEQRPFGFGGLQWMHAACTVVRQPGEAEHHLSALARLGEGTRELLAGELIPWALGHADPIQQRRRTGGERLGYEWNPVREVAVSDDNAWAISVCKGLATVWDIQRRARRTRLPHPRSSGGLAPEVFAGASLSPDSARLATGDDAGVIRVWEVAAGAVVWERPAHEGRVDALRALPDGRLVSGGYDGRVRVWDASDGAPLHEVAAHGRGVTALDASAEHDLLVSGDGDGVVRVSSLDGSGPRTLEHPGDVAGLALDPLGGAVWTAGARALRRWDLSGEGEPLALELPATAYVLALSRDGRWAATALGDCSVRLHDLEGEPAERACWWTLGLQLALTFSPDGRWLLTGGRNGALRRYDLTDLP